MPSRKSSAAKPGELVTRPSGNLRHVPMTLTLVALPTVIPHPKGIHVELCEWCGGKFDRDGNCKRCQRPA